MRTERGLAAGEAALDLFFETWRLSADDADSRHTRRLRLGALRVLQRVTAVGLEESRVMARLRLREARVELRRLVNAGGQADRRTGGRICGVPRWNELAVAVGLELSRLNQELCSPEPWPAAHPTRPSTPDPRPLAHDSRLATHDTRISD